ncbi:SC35-like splicing factor 30 [Actinidia rufa]|uniref:SC35-like splicing factor 30 n=1 Tax=Actinidia rufa TaxID=165716 RepID=A0A7J0EBR1_9ERIC|nr:SC35-like splicing factor 30 [Actinidia rufa]
MRRYSPPYHSPPRRGYGGRTRSPPRRGPGGGYGRNKEQNNGSLLVRNIPLNCRSEELRGLFERFGVVRDVYLPKDYYSGEPRGFAFVQFVDPYEAAEAQYHMNGQIFAGREISVVVAAETRKRPEEMRRRTGPRGSSGYGGRRSHYGMLYQGSLFIFSPLDDLGPVQYRDPGPPVTLLVLELVIAQGPFLLLQDAKLTTLYPQVEDVQTTQDHQEILQKSEMANAFAGRILPVMALI